ncbi:UNVERIFIED_CONTAM: hypothetical protein FKN15_029851 [Acipenser sinensis]
MSWLTDLAGKAENFLNKVDQGAATALSKQQAEMTGLAYDATDSSQYISAYKQQAPEYHPPPEVPSFITSAAVNIKKQKATLLSGTANVSSASQTTLEVNDRPSSRPSSHFVRPKKTEPDDDLLFDFLNSSDKTLNGKVDAKKETPKTLSSHSLSRTSSLSSISTGTPSNKTSEDGSSKDHGQGTPESSDSGLVAPSEPAKEEFQYLEEELHRTKNSLQSRIKDREEEVQKLRNQLTNKTLSNSSQTELENRLHQLTETLIQKQTMLEALSTEKNSLVFQLERLEQQLKSVQGSSTVNGPSINMAGMENTEGARMRNVPVLFSDGESTDAGMYGRVRNAASTIDRFRQYFTFG